VNFVPRNVIRRIPGRMPRIVAAMNFFVSILVIPAANETVSAGKTISIRPRKTASEPFFFNIFSKCSVFFFVIHFFSMSLPYFFPR